MFLKDFSNQKLCLILFLALSLVRGVVTVLDNLFYWFSQVSAFSFQVYSFHHSFLCKLGL